MDIRCSPKLWISAWHLTVPQTLPDTHFAIHWSPSLLVHFCIVSLSVPYSDSKEQRDVQKQPGQVRKLISPLVIQGGHEIWREDCEVSHWTILFFFFWPRLTACRISVSWPGIEPGPWQWKPRIPTTRPPGTPILNYSYSCCTMGTVWLVHPPVFPLCTCSQLCPMHN